MKTQDARPRSTTAPACRVQARVRTPSEPAPDRRRSMEGWTRPAGARAGGRRTSRKSDRAWVTRPRSLRASFATVFTSLSPRPERLTSTVSTAPSARATRDRVGDGVRRLERGHDALEFARAVERVERLVGAGHRTRTSARGRARAAGVLGTDRRVVETGRHRVRGPTWPSWSCRTIRPARAVQDAGGAAGEARGVTPRRCAAPPASTPTPGRTPSRDERRRRCPTAFGRRRRTPPPRREPSGAATDLQRAPRGRSRIGTRAPSRVRMRPEHRAEEVGVSPTWVTQSRSDSLIASLSVRAPASTPTHRRAPSRLHPKTFSAWRSHVLGAHVTWHSQAEERDDGGVRHAVLSGAGFGDHRRLPHPDARAAPGRRALLISWAPVCARSSRLRKTCAPPKVPSEPRRARDRGGAAAIRREQAGELAPEGAVAPRLLPGWWSARRIGAISVSGTKRPPYGPSSTAVRYRLHRPPRAPRGAPYHLRRRDGRSSDRSRPCARPPRTPASSRLFRPTAASTPLATSTPAGRARSTAAATFSGSRPPASQNARSAVRRPARPSRTSGRYRRPRRRRCRTGSGRPARSAPRRPSPRRRRR